MAKKVESTNAKPTHEAIAQRARAIYEASGCKPGRDLENWLAAEAELTAQRAAIQEPPPVTARAVVRPPLLAARSTGTRVQ